MRSVFLFLSLICVVSCKNSKTNEWKVLEFVYFTIEAPEPWEKVNLQGIDSYVGGLTNQHDTLIFDYGWYSPDIVDITLKENNKTALDTINGLIAYVVVPKQEGRGRIGLSIPKFNDPNDKFILFGDDIESNTGDILRMFKSLTFKESDTTKNPPLSMSSFTENPTVFQKSCSSCHTKFAIIVGPPLGKIKERRTEDWIYTFLTNRKSLANDSSYINLIEDWDYHCKEFPELTRAELQLIIDYIN